MTKLKTELNVVQGNIRVMSEMLTELTPTNIDPSDLELLQELNRTNRQMQQRLVELIDKIANEEATSKFDGSDIDWFNISNETMEEKIILMVFFRWTFTDKWWHE